MSDTPNCPIEVHVAPDLLSATVRVQDGIPIESVTAEDVRAALLEKNVCVDDVVVARIEDYISVLHAGEVDPQSEDEIAVGRPAVEGRDGEFVWHEDLKQQAADWCSDAPIDFYSISSIVTVHEGALIGRILPPEPSKAGMNILGERIAPTNDPKPVVVKDGVRLGNDGCEVFAVNSGRVLYENLELWMTPVVEIETDVDFRIGNLELTVDAKILGTVRDNFRIFSEKNVTIEGAIEAATVQVAGNLTVRGGILNRRLGHVTTEGEIVAKFSEDANLRAAGNIRLAKEAINSAIHTEGLLQLRMGAVIGGHAYARGGIEAHTLGSDANVHTEVAVGLHVDELRHRQELLAQNERRRTQVEKIRTSIEPMLANMNRLLPRQRERVTEMMCQVDSLTASIASAVREIIALDERSLDARTGVLVMSTIHEGVTVLIDDFVVTITNEIKGPVCIERRRLEGYNAVVAVHQSSGSVTELNARKREFAPLEACAAD